MCSIGHELTYALKSRDGWSKMVAQVSPALHGYAEFRSYVENSR